VTGHLGARVVPSLDMEAVTASGVSLGFNKVVGIALVALFGCCGGGLGNLTFDDTGQRCDESTKP
jgi:hypothetical protein